MNTYNRTYTKKDIHVCNKRRFYSTRVETTKCGETPTLPILKTVKKARGKERKML